MVKINIEGDYKCCGRLHNFINMLTKTERTPLSTAAQTIIFASTPKSNFHICH